MARIDILRAVTDPTYAGTLTPEDWFEISQAHEFQQMVAEQRELVEPVLANIPGFGQQLAPGAAPAPAVLNGPYNVVGTKAPRIQGLGIVSGLGQYTEHMTMPGTLYTRTLRSPHPHAKITK